MSVVMISSLFVPGNAAAKSPSAAVAVLVGQEGPYLAVAQACLVKAHVRTNIGGIEIKAAAKFMFAPGGITTYPVAV